VLDADSEDLLSAIQLRQPLTMSWSNVPDYWEAEVRRGHVEGQGPGGRGGICFMH